MPASMGLSPHVRGNPPRHHRGEPGDGSIPARAGEPTPGCLSWPSRWVYPRTCGGTAIAAAPKDTDGGLSPHVRGNRNSGYPPLITLGSIPARAGEPPTSFWAAPRSRVYPRTCGGTAMEPTSCERCRGLSPHVRGNRARPQVDEREEGSIPARAGEPGPDRDGPDRQKVYPRTCGGTVPAMVDHVALSGLSPHVRGNRRNHSTRPLCLGSIPARAGEPGHT